MKSYLSSAFIALALLSLGDGKIKAQSWLWAKSYGGEIYLGNSTVDPSNGDVYTTGYFAGTVDFDPGPATFNLTSDGYNAIFISKLDESGNFLWAKAMKGVNSDYHQFGQGYGASIEIDPGDNSIFITGYFIGTVDFDPGPGTNYLSSGLYYTEYNGAYTSTDAMFTSKFDLSGIYLWTGARTNDYSELGIYGTSVSVDYANGDVYVLGSFWNGTLIWKYSSLGSFLWEQAIGFYNYSGDTTSLAVDPLGSGDIYLSGAFNATTDFDPGTETFYLTPVGLYDIFVSKLDQSGEFLWAKAIGGTGDDGSNSIAATLNNEGTVDVYTTGSFTGTVDFDPGSGIFDLSGGGMFISKLDGSGNFLLAKAINGALGYSIAVEQQTGNVYTTGVFSGTVDFDPNGGVFNLSSSGPTDVFVSKLDESGNFEGAISAGGTDEDYGHSIKISDAGHAYVYGYYSSPSIPFGTTILTNTGFVDAFIAKLDGSFALPIELISFTASIIKNQTGVILEWITANEINNDFFAIESSRDLINFDPILKVDAAGNSNQTIRYDAYDPNPSVGKNYYRLSQTDIDGRKTFAPIVSVNVKIEKPQMTLYPNPATDKLTIELNDAGLFNSNVAVYNILGQLIYSGVDENSSLRKTIDISSIPNGIYMLELETEGKSIIQKFVKE